MGKRTKIILMIIVLMISSGFMFVLTGIESDDLLVSAFLPFSIGWITGQILIDIYKC